MGSMFISESTEAEYRFQQTFDEVLGMRERRLDIEEDFVEDKKLAEQQKKDMDSLIKKSKVMESQLKTAMDALEEFHVSCILLTFKGIFHPQPTVVKFLMIFTGRKARKTE